MLCPAVVCCILSSPNGLSLQSVLAVSLATHHNPCKGVGIVLPIDIACWQRTGKPEREVTRSCQGKAPSKTTESNLTNLSLEGSFCQPQLAASVATHHFASGQVGIKLPLPYLSGSTGQARNWRIRKNAYLCDEAD